MRIGIDLDEVVADSIVAILKFHNERYGTSLTRDDIHSYDLWEVWGGTKEEAMTKVFDFFATDAARNIDPVAGSMEALMALKDKGHELFIVTARSNDLIGWTEEWIEKYFPKVFAGAHFGNEYSFTGAPRKKSDICKELGVEIFIDDRLENVFECAEAGMRAILFDRPWNQREGALPKNVLRVFSWEEIVRKV